MASRQTHPATQRAKVITLAGRTGATLNQAGRNVIDRIRSCLARANHVNANEYEAQTALKMAHKIMAEHNIQQWQVMQMEDKDQLRKRAGISEVDIAFANGRRRVVFQTWVVDLVTAMAKFFECQVYSTGYDPPSAITWTFYGIREHTDSAALAFEMIHNLIQDWACARTAVSARNSYSIGVAHGLHLVAVDQSLGMEEAAKAYEDAAQAQKEKKESERFNNIIVLSDDDASNDGDDQVDCLEKVALDEWCHYPEVSSSSSPSSSTTVSLVRHRPWLIDLFDRKIKAMLLRSIRTLSERTLLESLLQPFPNTAQRNSSTMILGANHRALPHPSLNGTAVRNRPKANTEQKANPKTMARHDPKSSLDRSQVCFTGCVTLVLDW